MSQLGHLSAILGTVVSILPLLIPGIPPPYNAIAVAALGLANALVHLYAPSPATKS